MSDTRDFELAVNRWLDDGRDTTPSEVLDAVLLAARSTPQERDLRLPWRAPAPSKVLTLGAAAAIVIAVVVGPPLLGSLGSVGSTEPTTTPVASPTEASPAASAAFGTLPRQCAEVEAGTYRASIGPASITMSVPAGWSGSNNGDAFNNGDGFRLGSRSCLLTGGVGVGASMVSRVSASVCDGRGTPVETDSTAAVIAALAAQANHRTVTGPTDSTIAGYPATRFEFATGGGPEPCNTGPLWWTPDAREGPGMHYGEGRDTFLTVYVVDLDGSPLAITVDPGYPDDAADAADLDAIVASLRIEP